MLSRLLLRLLFKLGFKYDPKMDTRYALCFIDVFEAPLRLPIVVVTTTMELIQSASMISVSLSLTEMMYIVAARSYGDVELFT